MTIWEHISELRSRLLVCFCAIVVFSIGAHYFHEQIIGFLLKPLQDNQLFFLSPLDPLLFIFKVDIIVGAIASIPVVNWAVISFIRPATNKFSWSLFSGVYISIIFLVLLALIYGFLVVAPFSLKFLLSIKVQGITNMITASSYMSFLLTQILIIAIIFQIPLIMATGSYIGVLNPKRLLVREDTFTSLDLLVCRLLHQLQTCSISVLLLFQHSLFLKEV